MALIDLNERDVDKWTLRLVVERGTLVFECQNCRHLSEVDLLEMIGRFGTDALVGVCEHEWFVGSVISAESVHWCD
jgi:hypothetical protein